MAVVFPREGRDAFADRALIESLPEGVVWQSADGVVIDANAAAAPILGLTRDELLGRTGRDPRWYAVREDGSPWPGDEHPATVALRTGQPQHGAIMGIMVPGEGRRWICIHAVPMFDEGAAKPRGVVVSFAEVTRHLELRNELRRSAEELGALYDGAPCGFHDLDAQGRFQRINDTELAWLGVTRAQALRRLGPLDFLSEASREVFQTHFPRVRAGERLDGLVLEIVGAQGQRRYVRLHAHPVFDAQGRFTGTRSVLHDITEVHLRTQALEKLTAEQAAALNNDLVSIVRLRGRRIVWANRAFDRIFGYAPGELIGQSTRALFESQQAFEDFGEEVYPAMRAGQPYRAQRRLQRKDGATVWADCSGAMLDPVADEVFWFALDMTAQRRADELRVRAAELEAQNRELRATRELHSLFLSNVSHEMRTPLNAVIGLGELVGAVAARGDAGRCAGWGEQIATSGRRLLSMIDAMLELVSLEAGRVVFRPEPVALGEIAGEVVAMLADEARAAGVAVRMDVAAPADEVWLDPLRLRQVLLSYLGNAIKFSGGRGPVDLRILDAGAGELLVEVEDRGIGIAPDDQAMVFHRFRQLSAGTTKSHGGVGIGLALVKMLVEAQGGRVGLRSSPGAGSVFSAWLPAGRPAAGAADRAG